MPAAVETPPRENNISPIRRTLIANRGEIGVKIAEEIERRGGQAVVLYTDLDSERESYLTRIADRNMDRGWDLAPLDGYSASDTYSDPRVIVETAQMYGCDSIAPGYGFLSEKPEFVKMCEEAGIKFIGPKSAAMDLMGDKARSIDHAKQTRTRHFRHGIPVLPNSPVRDSIDELIKDVEEPKVGIEYPVMIKDPTEGGGAGNRIATNQAELREGYIDLRTKAKDNDRGLYVERYVPNAVHVEMQVVADQYGNVVCLGERDCTVQRKYQKLIEESPSPQITDRMRERMQEAAVALIKGASYENLATIEFLVDKDRPVGRDGDYEFTYMETNPRIQVEHPVTEAQTGINLVATQFNIAEGKALPFNQEAIKTQGFTMEVRVYAEDPERDFEPQEGRLDRLRLPEDIEGVRFEKGYEEGDEVSVEYDMTLFKVIAHADTREEAIRKLELALDRSQIAGVKSNREFLQKILGKPEFRQGTFNVDSLKHWMVDEQREAREKAKGIEELLGENGVYTPYPRRLREDEPNFPVNPVIKTVNSDRQRSRREIKHQYQERTGKECGAEYGVVERDGIRFVAYALNPDFNSGSFGKEESWVLEDACILANKNNLPLITITSTAGVKNTENSQGLTTMMNSVANITLDYPPLFHVDIRRGWAFGGVPASYAGTADLFIAVNDGTTYSGITGGATVASFEGVDIKEFKDADGKNISQGRAAYLSMDEEYGEGTTHTPTRHHEMRTGADILVSKMPEAGDKIAHMLTIIKKRHPQVSKDIDMSESFRPKEQLGYLQMPHPIAPYDSPDARLPGFMPPRLSRVWDKFWGRREEAGSARKLSIGERRRIIKHPDRLSAIDFLDTSWGLFNDAVLLDHISFVNGLHKTSPIIGALAQYKDFPLMVIAQQPQQARNESGDIIMAYEGIRPQDWRATRRFLDLAEKLDVMVVMLGNTAGVSPSRESEDRAQTTEIAETLERVARQKTPVISINYGMKGSGGGAPFIWYADRAAATTNATSWVADAPAMRSFLTQAESLNEDKATAEQIKALDTFAEQFPDATAEEQLKNFEIDEIIPEGPGGAHLHPRTVINGMKDMFDRTLPELWAIHEDDNRLNRQFRSRRLQVIRKQRKDRLSSVGSIMVEGVEEQVRALNNRLSL